MIGMANREESGLRHEAYLSKKNRGFSVVRGKSLHLRCDQPHNIRHDTIDPDEGAIVDMILLDWTRMGRSYCLAGAVAQRDGFQIVRPLYFKYRESPVRNVGWS